jgi:long-chain fatty acid transport protein
VSYAITDKISVGAGLTVLAYGAVNLQRDVPLPDSYGHIELDGEAERKIGFNAGVMFRPSEKFSLGINYRSKIDAEVKDGDVTFTGIDPQSAFAARFPNTKFSATLPLIATTSIGLGFMPTEKLTIGLDVNYAEWSKYKSLEFTFADPINGSNTSVSKRNYEDALTFRLGGQYKVTEGLTVRAGGAYDESPVRDGYVTPETPDANRVSGTIGASYAFGKFGVDFSTQFVSIAKRRQTQNQLVANGTQDRVAGTYKTNIVIPGIGLNYSF